MHWKKLETQMNTHTLLLSDLLAICPDDLAPKVTASIFK